MRLYAMELIKKRGIEVAEKTLTINDLEAADEVFLTNAVQGIRWVERFNASEFKNDFALQLHEDLIRSF